jgi:hypothetical protein
MPIIRTVNKIEGMLVTTTSQHFYFAFFLPKHSHRKNGAMLVHPRQMCPRPKILGCCIPWTKCPLAILPLTEPSHP